MCHSKTFSIHGTIDYAIVYSRQLDPQDTEFYQHWDVLRTRLHCQEIITEQDFDTYIIKDHSHFRQVADTVYAQPHTQAIWTATSGSTGDPKQQRIDHRSVLAQAQRLCQHLDYQSHMSSLHTNNLHHGASACYHFLPSMMKVKDHWIFNSLFLRDQDYACVVQLICEKKINKLFLYTPAKMLAWLKATPKVEHPVDITTLYYCTREMVSLAKDKNIRLIKSVFGDTTIGYGFLVKTVDCQLPLDEYEPNCIGPRLDDFFDFKIENQCLYINIPGLDQLDWKTSLDRFELQGTQYYFLGRGHDYRINDEWINHNEIESQVSALFDINNKEGATIVVDNEEQQVYLAIWIDNPQAEQSLDRWMATRYRNIHITKRAKGLDQQAFMGARKISRPALREYFRHHVPKLVSFTDHPWILS
jgi:acyl-coenzyme A synthetase/AMP-(fatty) acid ligase